jgi:hypothetical protein
MITKQIPQIFDKRVIDMLNLVGKNVTKEFKTEVSRDAENLFRLIESNPEVPNIIYDAMEKFDFPKKGLTDKLVSRYSMILFDYYRENQVEDETLKVRGETVCVEAAKNRITQVQENAFNATFENLQKFIDVCEISSVKTTIRAAGSDNVSLNGNTPEANVIAFDQLWNSFVGSHFSTITMEDKINSFQILFEKICKVNCDLKLKTILKLYFYDLVYAVSILTDNVPYKEAVKMVLCKE